MEACPTCGADLSRETIEATPEATTPETTTPDLLEPGLIPEKNILRFRRLLTSDGLFKQAVYSDDTLSELEPISWSEYYGLGDE